MARADLVRLPVHAGGAAVVHLHAVRADIAPAGLRVSADHEGQCDELSGVKRPALHHGQSVEVDVIPRQHHLLARGTPHCPGLCPGEANNLAQCLQFSAQARRRALHQLEHLADALRELVEVIDAKRPRHALPGAEDVDQRRHVVPGYVLEQQRWPAGLDDPVRDLSHLKLGVHRRADAAQVALLL